MKKKVYAKRVLKITTLVLALAVCVGFLQEFVLCHSDHNRERLKGFFLEDKNSIDVVLIGASEVYADYAAGYAYDKHGFTSYPIAIQSNVISNYKSQLKTVLEYQDPKLIVVEINGALYGDDKQFENEANFRNYVDNIPLSSNKIEAINEYAPEDKLDYYIPIIKYHSVWNDFPSGLKWSLSIMQDNLRGYNLLKGTKTKSIVYKPTGKVYNDALKSNNKKKKLTETSEYYLRDFLDYCKSEDINNIVFVRFPHVVNDKAVARFERCNTAADIIAEYGYDFINFEKNFEDTGLDVNTDFYQVDHLNIYGQKKFTEYFADVICEKYGISESNLTDAQKVEWDNSARYYEAFYQYAVDKTEEGTKIEIGENIKVMNKLEKYL